MSKKLQANGLWESSRMMLPQHKERINEHRSKDNVKSKPFIHDDELEMIYQNIRLSHAYTEEAEIELFDPYQNQVIKGIVTSVNILGKKIKIESENESDWVSIDNIVSVKLSQGDVG